MPDEDVLKGKLKQAEGRLQDAWGDLTGDHKHDVEGKSKQVQGSLQEGLGHAKDAARDADREALREEGREEQRELDAQPVGTRTP